MPDSDEILDVRGLLCPLPVLKARKRLMAMDPGRVLLVQATDPASVIDVPHYCNESGNQLVEHSTDGDTHNYWIRRT